MKTYVDTFDEQGEALKLAVLPPNAAAKNAGKLAYAKAYAKAVEGGAMIRPQLDKHLRRMNLWDDERQAEADRLVRSIQDGERTLERKLHPDGRPVRLKDGREIALRMARDRAALNDLRSARAQAEEHTAEAIALQAEFDHAVASCTVYGDGRKEGQPYFASADDYVVRNAERASRDAAAAMAGVLYGTQAELVANLRKLPENAFLIRYGFADEDLNLIDKDRNRVDSEGRRIDAEGYWVDDQGRRVDRDGFLLGDDGRYAEVADSFLDDDGNPVPEPEAD